MHRGVWPPYIQAPKGDISPLDSESGSLGKNNRHFGLLSAGYRQHGILPWLEPAIGTGTAIKETVPEILLAEDSGAERGISFFFRCGRADMGSALRRPLQQERGDVKRLTEGLPMHSATTDAQSFLSVPPARGVGVARGGGLHLHRAGFPAMDNQQRPSTF